jgi:hypothetical protein
LWEGREGASGVSSGPLQTTPPQNDAETPLVAVAPSIAANATATAAATATAREMPQSLTDRLCRHHTHTGCHCRCNYRCCRGAVDSSGEGPPVSRVSELRAEFEIRSTPSPTPTPIPATSLSTTRADGAVAEPVPVLVSVTVAVPATDGRGLQSSHPQSALPTTTAPAVAPAHGTPVQSAFTRVLPLTMSRPSLTRPHAPTPAALPPPSPTSGSILTSHRYRATQVTVVGQGGGRGQGLVLVLLRVGVERCRTLPLLQSPQSPLYQTEP